MTDNTDKDWIKAAVDIVAIIQAEGVDLKQRGKKWQGLCPFHDDQKTPFRRGLKKSMKSQIIVHK